MSVTKHPHDEPFSTRYSMYALGLLAVVNLVNYMDRMVLSVLLPEIQQDLNLSDSQLGWLTGMAFALVYATIGIPVARIADTGVRKHVIAIALITWSSMTALCGAAGNFMTLLLARIGVGAGEAGCIPPAHAIIADMTTPQKRAGAMAVFTAGATLGLMIGLSLGGLLAETIGWRWTFVIFALPGLFLAALVTFTLREPRRLNEIQDRQSEQSLYQAVRSLCSRSSYVHLVIGYALLTFITFGFAQWLPTYYIRSFDLSLTVIGLLMGFALGAGMTIGTLLGGLIANQLMPKDLRWGLWLAILGLVLSIPLYLVLLSVGDYRLAFTAHFIQAVIMSMAHGPVLASIQSVAKDRERATASALAMFFISVLGLGGGPLVVGYLSDFFAANGFENSLRVALVAATMLSVWPIAHFFLCSRSIIADADAVNSVGNP